MVNEIKNYNEGNRIIEDAFIDYNNTGPHSTIMYYSPLQFLNKWNNEKGFKEIYRKYLEDLKTKYRRRYNKRSVMKSVS
jgi:putative transposase